ncbi:MAG TPA: hypothetical protein VFV58_15900 [Blastocatellia bacterium]|jgi:hypothetical protein|nr:hypothetical protein [Blastocatellia bacterium]
MVNTIDSAQALRSSVERLYTVFTDYHLSQRIDGCPCCVTPADQAAIHSKPLRRLTHGDLEYYASIAMLTWGSPEDWKHFLPRIFEILAFEEGSWSPSTEVIIHRLDDADWRQWPQPEREAVEEYLTALWLNTLNHFPCFLHSDWHHNCIGEIDVCLCCIGQAVTDLSPFLDLWSLAESAPALRHLAAFVVENAHQLEKKGKLSNAFWKERPAQMKQVVNWLLTQNRVEALEQAFFKFADDPYAEQLSIAAGLLNYLINSIRD